MRIALKALPALLVWMGLVILLRLVATSGAGNRADNFAIDLETIGNTATSLGTREECLEVTAGDTVTFDVTATNIPAATAMIGFSYTVHYDPATISVAAAEPNFLLASAAGSSIFAPGDESTVPDIDGTFAALAADTSLLPGSAESGSGILERLTVEVAPGAASGGYALTMDAALAYHVDTGNFSWSPDAVFGARLAVDVTCASLGTPTPAPLPNTQDDVDCNGSVTTVDALSVLRYTINLSVAQTEPCWDLGAQTANGFKNGDVDCDNDVDPTDSLRLLRYLAGLSVFQNEPCPDIGT